MQAWLSDLAGRTKALVEEVASADLVVMVAGAGSGAEAASIIGESLHRAQGHDHRAGHRKRQSTDEEISKTVAGLRPYASMLVIANGDEYIEEMLAALRA